MSLFGKVTVIGIGLIGSSLARVIKRDGLARRISCYDVKPQYMQKALELGIVDEIHKNIADSVKNADLIVLSAPVGAYGKIIREIAPFLKNDAVITDVGSIKKYVIREIEANLPPDSKVSVVPGHPVAGTEKSGPEAGFDTLFEGRWFIMTPYERSSDAAVEKISKLWLTPKCGLIP